MTGRNLSPYMGRGFFADGVCTTMSASIGGTGMTTYAENIGVMAVTKVYSTTVFVVAGIFAILLGLSPKFGAVIHTIPVALLGGASIVVFGLITVAGLKSGLIIGLILVKTVP
jgi:xanthine/uracil permease